MSVPLRLSIASRSYMVYASSLGRERTSEPPRTDSPFQTHPTATPDTESSYTCRSSLDSKVSSAAAIARRELARPNPRGS